MASLWRKTNSDWEKVTSTFPIEVPVRIGSNVQTKSGTFNTDESGWADIDCGFTPDIIILGPMVTLEDPGMTADSQAVVSLIGTTPYVSPMRIGMYYDTTDGIHLFACGPGDSGFGVANLYGGFNFDVQPTQANNVPYTAYKFL